jgi:chromosome condensin MukBEF ATPase and DNA-binding subunit MukB
VSVRIQKIRSRIEVIAEDGPHEKIRAIQAFEQSDPVRLYREILKRSLIEQKSTEVLCEEYKKQGKEFLDLDEIAALRQFLTQIRYSSM